MTDRTMINRARLAELTARERAQYAVGHPASMRAFDAAGRHLLGGVPMTWMRMWPGGFPLYLATAHGARVTDIAHIALFAAAADDLIGQAPRAEGRLKAPGGERGIRTGE